MTASLETVPVFYDDVYRRELEVWVDALRVDEKFGPCLVFSETLCHPHGGGQKGDRGELTFDPGIAEVLGGMDTLPIVDTRKGDGGILHVLGEGVDAEAIEEALVGSQPFLLQLNWDFRNRQMRLHSAAHLLHCFVERVLEREVRHPETSDLQPDFGLNRYEQKDLLSPEQVTQVLEALNAFTAEGHAITTYPDEQKAGFRFWRCEGWVIPCGGTHPTDTTEIGPVRADLSTKRGRTSLKFYVD